MTEQVAIGIMAIMILLKARVVLRVLLLRALVSVTVHHRKTLPTSSPIDTAMLPLLVALTEHAV
jgi:hypothetical protein